MLHQAVFTLHRHQGFFSHHWVDVRDQWSDTGFPSRNKSPTFLERVERSANWSKLRLHFCNADALLRCYHKPWLIDLSLSHVGQLQRPRICVLTICAPASFSQSRMRASARGWTWMVCSSLAGDNHTQCTCGLDHGFNRRYFQRAWKTQVVCVCSASHVSVNSCHFQKQSMAYGLDFATQKTITNV